MTKSDDIVTMKKYKTEQEEFWAGKFGDDYSVRNYSKKIIASNLNLFSKIFSRMEPVNSVIEFGSNIGLNLFAINQLEPDLDLSAIEINHSAVSKMKELLNGQVNIYEQSILDFTPDEKRDVVLIKGVLIHINPEELENVYSSLYETTKKYLIIAEYYNPTPVMVNYRGNSDKLFKRDFCGEIMKKYPDLKLVDYGFVYHADPQFPADDFNWFLLEKK